MDKKGFLKGAAIGALIASVATLFMAPKSGKKTRADVKKLVDTLSSRIMKEAGSMANMSQETYDKLVNRSVADYAKGKSIATDYLDDVTTMLKKQWKFVQKELNENEKELVNQAAKAVKKTKSAIARRKK